MVARLISANRFARTRLALLLVLVLAACAAQAPVAQHGPAVAMRGPAPQARLYSFHCLDGACPRGAGDDNALVVREIYALSSNPTTKLADWVAYVVSPETVGPSRSRNWAADPWLDPAETLEPQDYERANAVLGTDRGHQAPLAAFSGTEHWAATNLLSNITPQMAPLNQGPWERLEAQERRLAGAGESVFVLTGPLFERGMAQLPAADEDHRLPSGYWKVIVSGDGAAAAAFVFEQETARNAAYCEHEVAIADVEARSRLQLFPGRAQAFSSLSARLGCGEE